MDRRQILQAATVAGAASLAAGSSPAVAADRPAPAAGLLPGGFVATADGTQLFVRDWGAGRPVVLLASWALPSDSWSYQMLPLVQAGHRCIAYDRRGHGRSSDPGRGYDFDTLADDLAAVLDALDLEGATLVGFSMATGEIVRYLSRHGSARIARLVLVGTTTPCLPRAADNPHGVDPAIFEAFRREQLLRDYPQWIDDNLLPFATAATSPALRDWIRTMALSASLQALHDCHVAITSADFRAELPRITVPTLLLHGGADQTSPLPLTGQPTAQLLPNAELAVYEDAPHGIPYSHMDRFNRDLLAFLGR
jgi:pimeloyl-ACP methyl ester carboxylesterase